MLLASGCGRSQADNAIPPTAVIEIPNSCRRVVAGNRLFTFAPFGTGPSRGSDDRLPSYCYRIPISYIDNSKGCARVLNEHHGSGLLAQSCCCRVGITTRPSPLPEGNGDKSSAVSSVPRCRPVTGALPAAVRLHVLHDAKMAPVYGAWMAGALDRRGYRVTTAALLSVLFQMERENLLLPDRQFVDGRLRRVHDITAHGIWALKQPEFVLGLGELKIDP